MDKEIIVVFIIGFWLSFGVASMFFNYADFPQFETHSLTNSSPLTAFIDFVTVFFSCVFFYVPSIPIYVTFILNFLQLISLFAVILIVKSG